MYKRLSVVTNKCYTNRYINEYITIKVEQWEKQVQL